MAISPQLPDNSLSTVEKNNLEYHVLSDANNKVSTIYKLNFTVPTYMIEHYKNFGADLKEHNGDDSWVLPVPATLKKEEEKS